jgi:hypothetical protein
MERQRENVYCYNPIQATFYINKGCKLLSVDVHRKTLRPFWVFDKNDTQEAYNEWCSNKKE